MPRTIKKFAKTLSILIVITFAILTCKGQSPYNLVPNYSFEDSVICPNTTNGGPIPRPWYIPSNYNTNFYLNICTTIFGFGVPYNYINDTSFQYAKMGNGYASFDTYIPFKNGWRSYIQVKLSDSLQSGKCYHCQFWISLGNPCGYATNNIAMWLAKTAKYVDTIAYPLGFAVIPANPQVYNYNNPVVKDTQNWVKVSSIYIAQGGERFITIGNFKNNANTIIDTIGPDMAGQTLYYVDDVSVIPLDSLPLKADAGPNATIATGDSVFIGSLTNGITNITWYNAAGQVINTVAPGFYVSPTANTFYVVEQTVCGYTSRDTVNITVNPLPLKLLTFTARAVSSSLSFGEGRGEVLLRWQTANEFNVSHYNIQRSLRGSNEFQTIGTVPANNKPYNEYSYVDELTRNEKQETVLYRLQSIDKDGQHSYSAIRRVKFDKETSALTIYPNPATGFINISFSNMKQVAITDATGRTVLTRTFHDTGNTLLNVSSLPKGIYLVKVTGVDNRTQSQKLIINSR